MSIIPTGRNFYTTATGEMRAQYLNNNNNDNNNKACVKISRNKSRRQGNHIVEPANTNWQNYTQQQIRLYNPW